MRKAFIFIGLLAVSLTTAASDFSVAQNNAHVELLKKAILCAQDSSYCPASNLGIQVLADIMGTEARNDSLTDKERESARNIRDSLIERKLSREMQ